MPVLVGFHNEVTEKYTGAPLPEPISGVLQNSDNGSLAVETGPTLYAADSLALPSTAITRMS